MKAYKILHRPSGLFYKPSRHRSKANLSKQGKIYEKKPTLKYLGSIYHHPLTKEEVEKFQKSRYSYDSKVNCLDRYESKPVVDGEWEVVEFSLGW